MQLAIIISLPGRRSPATAYSLFPTRRPRQRHNQPPRPRQFHRARHDDIGAIDTTRHYHTALPGPYGRDYAQSLQDDIEAAARNAHSAHHDYHAAGPPRPPIFAVFFYAARMPMAFTGARFSTYSPSPNFRSPQLDMSAKLATVRLTPGAAFSWPNIRQDSYDIAGLAGHYMRSIISLHTISTHAR